MKTLTLVILISLTGVIFVNAQLPAILDSNSDSAQSELNPLQSISSDTFKIVNKSIHKFDSIRSAARLQPDSLRTFNTDKADEAIRKQVDIKADSLKSKAQEKVLSAQSKINEKLSFPKGSGLDSIITDLPLKKELPEINFKIPVSLPDTDVSLNIPKEGLTIPDAQLPRVDIPQTPSAGLPTLDQPKIPKNVTEIIDTKKEVLDKAANVNTKTIEQLPEDLESKAAQLDEVQELAEQRDRMERYKDPMVMKEEALNKAKETAVNHFKGHEEELKAAMEEFAKVRAKIPDPDGVYDMMKKQSNPYKGKAFVERIQPGITFQIQKSNSIWLDINPYLLYKLSGRFYTGLGWNERLAYSTSDNNFEQRSRIYGPRINLQFKAKSHLWLKAEAEDMNVSLPSASADFKNRQWVWSFFGGVRNDFQLSKRLLGNIQILYNLYNPNNRSPYANRLNVRFALEIIRKKNSHN